MNTALKAPAPAANIRLFVMHEYWYFDCWGTLAQSRPQFAPDECGMSRANPTGRPAWMLIEHVATEILVHNPTAVFAGDVRAREEAK